MGNKYAHAGIINEDLATGAKEPESLLNTTARPCSAHNEGDNQQKEYIVDSPSKGKLGAIGQAGN